ncbi:MAG: efflux RND transporter periplasmic adaptor subunit [Desulfomonilia bacterium]|jgi:membrane fusion protein (multidrug efflux system)|uniref:Multidrug efflux system n=1 Tax=anaerobic digester metagenome TaxID=1263854 RepID=A0A485M0J3_9ZZZZ|nr:efflux RND transporter periplasmic adaptor subunit [Pseudomonadota bacterium]HON39526.1 efflux RND transporter periplasmic adaptor subunit [Deltaproteobacteria bacterium]HRS56853.1 efflux RND transporter periplasmic adaptor subunit [Desulfomonilia bacterium]HPD22460.1 efflux RND transporter periplasmic adaptor subunit [Deltaproteobacteria bacterium]HPX19491.1 efflux RND transporter periplasmic adaptor subunit [Deltaproteobacteria bacterium]
MKSCAVPVRISRLCILTIAFFTLLIGACGRQQAQTSPPLPEVTVIEAKQQQVELTTELPGRTSAYLIAEVRPQVSGIIKKRHFKEGSFVKEGQILYQIDPAPFQAAYDSAAASLARAQANLPALEARAGRYRELLAGGAVSQQDFDDVDSAFRQAQAEVAYWEAAVESARINLGYTRVTAPISGMIGKSNMTEGALATANQPVPLATIQQFNPIYVDVPQSTTDLLRLKRRIEKGILTVEGEIQKKVGLLLEDGSEYPLDGTLEFRDVTVDPTTGTVTLRAVFPNPDSILLPGMFVRAVVREGIDKQAILIPQSTVSRDPKGNALTLVVDGDGIVRQCQIEIDRAMGDQWLVASGLSAGDLVIVEGALRVRPGMQVKAVPSAGGDHPVAKSAASPAAAAN